MMIYSNNFDKFQKIMAIQIFISVPFLLKKKFTIYKAILLINLTLHKKFYF